ncbi:hypothetical protein [Couchioplanes caeruleus]|uniref:Uncharacterized protein n=2 Tax=Couchioplanes caeruleus TaxID=56438 RepID=A0A1K0G8P2_9ACTN|nr:hypothetical protein [Couchioplanes caeruleus]OJF13618.1 hypothetical protein BG844_14245 [Couchioplanes caeruleus subsp. caeruleus]ROP33111.1 hypothetical protein EDD30_6080 [Couchioplanes caeruleus]
MAVVARLLPRLWDGRRLLQFLTGLALIALAFAIPALTAAPRPADTAVTVATVDAPHGRTAWTDRIEVAGPAAVPAERTDAAPAAPTPVLEPGDATQLGDASFPRPGSAALCAQSGRGPPLA